MLPKPPGCAGCPLEHAGRGFVPGFEPAAEPALLVQGEAPGAHEITEGQPFVGPAGFWLRKNILAAAHVAVDTVVYDNTLRCLPPCQGNGEAYPPAKDRAACEQQCRQYDIWDRWPRTPLLLFGGNATRQRLGVGSISRWHGHVERVGDRLVGATFHPSAVMRNPNLLPVVVAETANLMRLNRTGLPALPMVVRALSETPRQPFACDLEWDETGTVTVVGIATSNDFACSTWNVDGGLAAVNEAIAAGTPLIGHNVIDADLRYLNAPRDYTDAVFDTMIAAHLVHAHLAGASGSGGEKDVGTGLLGLGDLCRMYFGAGNWKADKDDLLLYNGYDCAYTYKLYEALRQDLQTTQQEHLRPKQQRLAHLTRLMHERGLRIDAENCRIVSDRQKAHRADIAAQLPFNPNSPKQVIAWAKANGIRLANTQEATLQKALRQYPQHIGVWEPLLDLKSDWKSLKTWFPEEAVAGGMLYPRFHVTGTAVGRLSSSGPNFQNLPPALRRLVLPPKGAVWFAADYSQIENRMLAWLAGDTEALKAYASGLDMHKLTASRLFRKRLEDVTPEERYTAKTVVHAAGYLETARHLAERLFGSRGREQEKRASELQEAYFAAYPRIRAWQRSVSARLESGQIGLRNPFGRWRCVYAQTPHERAKRGVHFLGCSTAADIIGEKALNIWDCLGLVPSLIVHDELVYALDPSDTRAMRGIVEIMSGPVRQLGGLQVPVEAQCGHNYGKYSVSNSEGLRPWEGECRESA